jgi:nitrate/TMAO reductase-like tetraheme cytochrome c subunit
MRQSQKISRKTNFSIYFKVYIFTVLIPLFFFSTALGAEPNLQAKFELPPPNVPQPQLFCGYCHVLTYPKVVQKGYELWKKGKHNKFGCVECHYMPKGTEAKLTAGQPATEIKAGHIPKKPPEHFSYLPLGGNIIQTRPKISDSSCMTAACHGRPDDQFKTKKIKFTEKVLFVHEPHLDKKKQIEGQQVTCVSCHQHETDLKKFEVTKASCHLCHFKNVKFNQDRGRCELCHELPKKPIQTSGEKPITHQVLKDANVSCGSCHYDVIQATGRAKYEAYFEKGELKTALVMGAGDIKKGNCLTCHDQAKALKEVANKKLMHEKHVTAKNARCFDCHQVIKHKKSIVDQTVATKTGVKKAEVQTPMSERFVTDSCLACHPKPHELQRKLAEGMKRKDVPDTPGFHFKARATCMACHLEEQVSDKGVKVLKASAKSCVACHKGREKLLEEWKDDLKREIKYTKEVEKEAIDALSKSKTKLSKEKLAAARAMLWEGRENLNIVVFGNGVHNKKYSLFLLDAAITRFEDMIDFLEEGQ